MTLRDLTKVLQHNEINLNVYSKDSRYIEYIENIKIDNISNNYFNYEVISIDAYAYAELYDRSLDTYVEIEVVIKEC